MKFKTELHCHTKEISPCSNESFEEVVEKYIENGYTTLVITNHARSWHWENMVPGDTWEEKVDAYFDVVNRASEYAGDRLNVLGGMEISFDGDPNDYLVFGITPEQLLSVPEYYKTSLGDFHSFAAENGFVIIQAHPMRFGMMTANVDWLDGYEIYNGHIHQHSHNDIAEAWGKRFTKHDLILTSGSDNHYKDQTPNSGIITDEPITSNKQLLAVLRGGKYELIRPDLGAEMEY